MSISKLSLVLLAAVAAAAGFGFARAPTTRESDQDHRPLLVTSSLGSRSAILFVLDPATRNLAAYEAVPGESPGNSGLRLLGARKIEHDLELAKYRDLSEFDYFSLQNKKNESHGGDGEKKTSGEH